ncbi:MAG: hypothetical protein LBU32_19355 [Clostridiales bacterium]|jgi:hypothetical protein|nr:hypothetical protein [Clostridiales bacterium]
MRNRGFMYLGVASCVLGVALLFKGISTSGPDYAGSRSLTPVVSVRSASAVDFTGLTFNEWDFNDAASYVGDRAMRNYTVMVYMNGSDLESENGAATADLAEMASACVDSRNVNLVLLTGGTNRWQNAVVPENTCALWELADGNLEKIKDIGLVNMGDPGTLSSFLNFCHQAFPAEKFGLIMWDHGGGSIAGYGQDEKFNNSNLTLLDMNYAFEKSIAAHRKLEFLGFDSCLMATVEMAVVAANYAKYMIASEDVEPGDGWDYSFLRKLSEDPLMEGDEAGKLIVDSFMSYYGRKSEESLTMSVVDLSRVGGVMNSLGDLMEKAGNKIQDDDEFRTLAKKRRGTKTFGEGSPRDNECDMVDIGDMASKLSDMFPHEAQSVYANLKGCVIYNRHNSDYSLQGLSAYYIYGGRDIGSYTMGTYESLKMDKDYTNYQKSFLDMLRSRATRHGGGETVEEMQTAWRLLPRQKGQYFLLGLRDSYMPNEGLWPQIEGRYVCLYRIATNSEGAIYAAPASLNGKDCDIVVAVTKDHPDGMVYGARQNDGLVIQKGEDMLVDGDRIAFYHLKRDFANALELGWVKGEEFTVSGEAELKWVKMEGDAYFSSKGIDAFGNEVYSQLKSAAMP